MKKLMILALLGVSTSALACSQLPAFGVFVAQNDKNHDSRLSKKEFLKAKVDGNLVLKVKLNQRGFRQLDKNHDGYISWNEPDAALLVEYKRAPCADWEERMSKLPPNAELPAQ